MKKLLLFVMLLISVNSFSQMYGIRELAIADVTSTVKESDFIPVDGYLKIKGNDVEVVVMIENDVSIDKLKIRSKKRYDDVDAYVVTTIYNGKEYVGMLFIGVTNVGDFVPIMITYSNIDLYLKGVKL